MQDKESQDDQPQRVLRELEIKIPSGKSPERLDVFLARQVSEITRTKAQEMIGTGEITLNGREVKSSYKVQPDDVIRMTILSLPPLDLEAEEIPLEIVHEDEWLVVVNKPAGMVVHPAQGNRTGTMVNALLWHYNELPPSDDPDRPGIVHRLDKDTSGLLVVCKREPALSRLAAAFRQRKIEREYRAIAWWSMPKRQGIIDKPIGRDPHDRKKFTIHPNGKPSRTGWRQLEEFDYLVLLSLCLETGRTHQIRVHLSSIGHPVFGDHDYAGRNRQLGKLNSAKRREVAGYFERIDRQMLHAMTLGFTHPVTGQKLRFSSPFPEDFEWLLNTLRSIRNDRCKEKR